MNKSVIIVAGGSGTRIESDIPKQFLNLVNRPILMHSISAFHEYDKSINIVLVLPENSIELWKKLCHQHNFTIKHNIVKGGSKRFFSVKNGLSKISDEGLTAVHDGARPLVKKETISLCFSVAEESGNAVPAIIPSDSMRILKNEINNSIDRNSLRIIQTPQVFNSTLLKKAFEQDFSEIFTDEANVVENYGGKINLVEGDKDNIKITFQNDIDYARSLLSDE
ncbi:2-C-methyl-D-erythritol 4-phosphate cytidylyltransferase [Bacteroidota bacterium]